VALAEPSAAKVPIQWHQPNYPPLKNVSSAVSPGLATGQFGGSNANFAAFAEFAAYFAQLGR